MGPQIWWFETRPKPHQTLRGNTNLRREVSRSSGARSNFRDCFLHQTWDSESGGHAPIREGYGANKCRPQSPGGAWAAPASEPETHPVHEGVLDVASGLLAPRKPKPRRLEDAVVPVDEVHLVLSVDQHHVPERPENALQPRSTARGDSLRGKVLQPNAPRSKHWGATRDPPCTRMQSDGAIFSTRDPGHRPGKANSVSAVSHLDVQLHIQVRDGVAQPRKNATFGEKRHRKASRTNYAVVAVVSEVPSMDNPMCVTL